MTFEDLIKGVGEKLNIELSVVEGATNLLLDDMEVSILELPELNSVVLSGKVGDPPPQGLRKLFEALLDANYNFTGTAGATLSRNPDTGTVVLTRCLPLEVADVDRFLPVLESFANVMETWKKILENYRPDDESEGGSAKSEETIEMPSFGGGFMQV